MLRLALPVVERQPGQSLLRCQAQRRGGGQLIVGGLVAKVHQDAGQAWEQSSGKRACVMCVLSSYVGWGTSGEWGHYQDESEVGKAPAG